MYEYEAVKFGRRRLYMESHMHLRGAAGVGAALPSALDGSPGVGAEVVDQDLLPFLQGTDYPDGEFVSGLNKLAVEAHTHVVYQVGRATEGVCFLFSSLHHVQHRIFLPLLCLLITQNPLVCKYCKYNSGN